MTPPPTVSRWPDDRSSYICDPLACIATGDPSERNPANGSGHCWHESAWRRLAWQYGESRAATIMLGQDLRTEKDRAAWLAL